MFQLENRLNAHHFSTANSFYEGRCDFEKYNPVNGSWQSNMVNYQENIRGYHYAPTTELYADSVTSSGSDDYDESFYQLNTSQRQHISCTQEGNFSGTYMEAAKYPYPSYGTSSWVFSSQTNEERNEKCFEDNSCILVDDLYRTNFSEKRDIHTTYSNFDTARGASEFSQRQSGRDHLSEIKAISEERKTLSIHDLNSQDKEVNGMRKKKKRYRPFAAQRERERLVVMNSALRKLKMCLPLDLQKEKLSKRDILQMASLHIKYLSEVLEQGKANTLNLNKHDYILQKSKFV